MTDPYFAAVVKLPKVGMPSVKIDRVAETAGETMRIEFDTSAPRELFDFMLEQSADMIGPWEGNAMEPVQRPEKGYSIEVPRDSAERMMFYRVRLRRK